MDKAALLTIYFIYYQRSAALSQSLQAKYRPLWYWYNDKNEREGSHLTPYDETLRTLRQQADRLNRCGACWTSCTASGNAEERERTWLWYGLRSKGRGPAARPQPNACFYLGRRGSGSTRQQEARTRHADRGITLCGMTLRRWPAGYRFYEGKPPRSMAASSAGRRSWTTSGISCGRVSSVHAERILQLEQQLATADAGNRDWASTRRRTRGRAIPRAASCPAWTARKAGDVRPVQRRLITDRSSTGIWTTRRDVETKTQLRRFSTLEATDVSIQAWMCRRR